MAHDLMRGVKDKNFWVMEEQSGPCGWSVMGNTPEPGQIRLWTYQAVAHGAEAIVYFRWRACLFGPRSTGMAYWIMTAYPEEDIGRFSRPAGSYRVFPI